MGVRQSGGTAVPPQQVEVSLGRGFIHGSKLEASMGLHFPAFSLDVNLFFPISHYFCRHFTVT